MAIAQLSDSHEETPAQDRGGVWALEALAKRPGELGTFSRDVSRALDALAQITSEFSCGSARSSMAVSVISESVQQLADQLEDLTARSASLRDSSERAAQSADESAELAGDLSQESSRGLEVLAPLIDSTREISGHVVRVHELVETLARTSS